MNRVGQLLLGAFVIGAIFSACGGIDAPEDPESQGVAVGTSEQALLDFDSIARREQPIPETRTCYCDTSYCNCVRDCMAPYLFCSIAMADGGSFVLDMALDALGISEDTSACGTFLSFCRDECAEWPGVDTRRTCYPLEDDLAPGTCNENSDCLDGYRCLSNICLPEQRSCRSDLQCGKDELCLSGKCWAV